MTRIHSVTIFILFITTLNLVAETSDTLFISTDSLKHKKFYLADFDREILWRYHPGDNSDWALPNFNHNGWEKINPFMDMQEFDVADWMGIAWFRKVIRIDSSLVNSAIGIYVHHEGASELFINGKKVLTFGKVSADRNEEKIHDPGYAPYVINLDTSRVYTIAVRYSNHRVLESRYFYNKFFSHIGFSLYLFDFNANVENELLDYYDGLAFGWGLDGFTLAFSIIFFLLYFFYAKRKENLYFALFIFGISIFGTAFNLQKTGPGELELIAFYRFLQFGGVSLTFIFFLLFIYRIVYEKVIKMFWIFLLAFFLINLTAFFGSEGIFSYMMPLGIVIAIMTIESIRVFIIGIIRKVARIWILATGAIIFLILTLSGMVLPDLLPASLFNSISGIMFFFNIVALPISMAVYLAISYGKTQNDLEKQIITVKELSAKQIEQERKNAELRVQAELERAENERKSRELEEARQLQLSMLPKEIPKLPHLDIATYMKTATEVGGDFYDFHLGDDGTLTVIIADATGHGMQAGTLVTATKGLFQNLAGVKNLEIMFQQFNRAICAMGLQPLLMALTIVRIKENQLEVINGGMPELLIYRKDTVNIKEIEPSGPPLGAFCDYDYKITKAELSPGDVILLMSDGFLERQNEKNEIFGIESCKTIFKQIADSTPQEMINRLVRESDEWANKRMQDDDITFISIKTE